MDILVVEDNRVNRVVAEKMLARAGHTITIAEHGLAAVEICKQQQFDIILMDVQMPVLDGISASIQIRKGERAHGRYTPIIALTAHAMHGDRERFLENGLDGYVSKPIDRGILFAVIDEICNKLAQPAVN